MLQHSDPPILQRTINPRAKRLTLRVDQRDGTVKLTVPKWTPKWKINRFLDKHQEWILERQNALLPKITVQNGAKMMFQGIEHEIVIEPHSKRTTEISILSSLRGGEANAAIQGLQEPLYELLCPDGPRNDDNEPKLLIKTARPDPTSNLKRWIIEQAQQTIEPLAHQKAERINKKISKIDLRDTKSRWGSCSTDKRLMLSWRLIMAPAEVLDYVVAHEVAHLQYMDHSRDFWDLCYALTKGPEGNATAARQWLKDNGNSLMQWF